MSVTVHCQKCGTENRLGQLFCRECGAKLDLSNLQPSDTRRKRAAGPIFTISRIIRLTIMLALLATLGLLCWPASPRGDAPSAQGAAIVAQKMTALRGAILRKNEVMDVFFEADINAHLTSQLVGRTSGGGKLNLELKEVRLDIKPVETFVWLKTTLGPLPLSYSTYVRSLRNETGLMEFTAGKVYVGRLPMPGPLRSRILNQMASIFQTLQEESALMARLADVQIVEGAINAATYK